MHTCLIIYTLSNVYVRFNFESIANMKWYKWKWFNVVHTQIDYVLESVVQFSFPCVPSINLYINISKTIT
jgi:hypothetical protein